MNRIDRIYRPLLLGGEKAGMRGGSWFLVDRRILKTSQIDFSFFAILADFARGRF